MSECGRRNADLNPGDGAEAALRCCRVSHSVSEGALDAVVDHWNRPPDHRDRGRRGRPSAAVRTRDSGPRRLLRWGAGWLDPVTLARLHVMEVVEADLDGAPGIAVRGEVDIAVAPDLELRLDEAIRATQGAFVLDLDDVEFIDSSGLGVILRARALLGREDRALVIVCRPGPVRRLFDVAGVADLLFLFASREEAAAALVKP